jgi:hypothetical protein
VQSIFRQSTRSQQYMLYYWHTKTHCRPHTPPLTPPNTGLALHHSVLKHACMLMQAPPYTSPPTPATLPVTTSRSKP